MIDSDTGWRASDSRIAELERENKPAIYRESAVPPYQLPDILRAPDGSTITTPAQWQRVGRPATLELFTRHVYGRAPAAPTGVRFTSLRSDAGAMNGRATELRCRIELPTADGDRPFFIKATVFVPNTITRLAPAFLLLDNRGVSAADPDRRTRNDFWPAELLVDRGYAAAVVQVSDIQPDDATGVPGGVIEAFPLNGVPTNERWGTIAAWAWGASRIVDWLVTVPGIDPARVAVIGHSRGGKAALWAGATDTRIAMVVANESGCGGAALSRRRFGETVSIINTGFPHWFCTNFKRFNNREEDLPIDQHQLLGTLAPRAVYVASADLDLWADPRGEFLGLAAASPVYGLFGNEAIEAQHMPSVQQPLWRGALAYHIRAGAHDLTLFDWTCHLDFADRTWTTG